VPLSASGSFFFNPRQSYAAHLESIRCFAAFDLVVSCLLLALAPLPWRRGRLATRSEEAHHGSWYKHSHWGILVCDPTARPLWPRIPTASSFRRPRPALFCAAALGTFEPTPLETRFTVADAHRGPAQRHLILVASGDLTLGGRRCPTAGCLQGSRPHLRQRGTDGELTDTTRCRSTSPRQIGRRRISARWRRADRRPLRQESRPGSGPDLLLPLLVNDNIVDVVSRRQTSRQGRHGSHETRDQVSSNGRRRHDGREGVRPRSPSRRSARSALRSAAHCG